MKIGISRIASWFFRFSFRQFVHVCVGDGWEQENGENRTITWYIHWNFISLLIKTFFSRFYFSFISTHRLSADCKHQRSELVIEYVFQFLFSSICCLFAFFTGPFNHRNSVDERDGLCNVQRHLWSRIGMELVQSTLSTHHGKIQDSLLHISHDNVEQWEFRSILTSSTPLEHERTRNSIIVMRWNMQKNSNENNLHFKN